MFFWKRNGQTHKPFNELLPGEVWLMPGEFRMEEANPSMTGFFGLPGGYGALAASSKQEKALNPFHTIVQHTVEEVSAELPVALTVSDYTGHTCTLWEERFPGLREMALEQCAWSMEQAVHEGKQYVFVFGQLPKELYEALYRCINMEIPCEDVYLNFSVLKKGMPLHFDGVSTPEKSALLNLHVDWGHLVLIIQAAPNYPTEKLTEALANACRVEGWTFSDHTKK